MSYNIETINSVKNVGNDFVLVNNILSCHISNKQVQQWLAEGNTPEPEFTEEELAKQEINKTNSEARQALTQGDWKVIRELERLLLKDTKLNIEREALRASVIGE